MKLKAKLADEYEYNWHAQHGPGATAKDIEAAFLAGFEKAREMAVVACMDGEAATAPERIEDVGEEDVVIKTGKEL